MADGWICNALAISHSPFGQGRLRAFARVAEDSPASRETRAIEVPRFRKAAMMSAGCQFFGGICSSLIL